jgi:monovalent cation:proton antiporter-2 (CPA2) family protein
MNVDLLALSLLFLIAAVTLVPLFKKAGLGSILGYLAAGVILGPTGLHLLKEVDGLMHLAEFGVVMLLFLIGLELKPAKLWGMRKSLIGLGFIQVFLTSLVLLLVLWTMGYSWAISLMIAVSLSLSSTAFALQTMTERNQLRTQYGQNAFSILLFQDIIAIPLLAIVPLLRAEGNTGHGNSLADYLIMLGVFVGLILFSKYLLRPLLRIVAQTRTKEVFTALNLLIVLGVAYLMREIGLSMALGAFLAGILLSDSEYRHQIETDLEPFKGLLLGLFFIAIGMTVNFDVVIQTPWSALFGVIGLIAIKYVVVFAIAKFIKMNLSSAQNMAVILAQGGEFAFVVFASAYSFNLITQSQYNYFIVLVTFSMIGSAVLGVVQDKWREAHQKKHKSQPEFDKIDESENPVIIAGFGRVGQISGRMLRSINRPFVALELDPEQVEVIRRFGNKIYYGDASRLDLLETAGLGKAKIFILAVDDVETSIAIAKLVREHFPHVKIFARARNRTHVFELRELGVTEVWRETFSSSLEIAEGVLTELGYSSQKVTELVKVFCEKDHQMLEEQYKVHRNQDQMIAASKQGTEQLQQLMNERVKV